MNVQLMKNEEIVDFIFELIKTHKKELQDCGKPNLQILNRKIYNGELCLDLATRPLTMQLFELFFYSPNWTLSKNELVEGLYGIEAMKNVSKRLQDSRVANSVKLISRARQLAYQELTTSEQMSQVEWFGYDGENWSLFKWKKSDETRLHA